METASSRRRLQRPTLSGESALIFMSKRLVLSRLDISFICARNVDIQGRKEISTPRKKSVHFSTSMFSTSWRHVSRCPRLVRLTSSEKAISSVAETGQDVALIVQFAIETCAVDLNVRVSCSKAFNSFRCSHQAEKANPCRSNSL